MDKLPQDLINRIIGSIDHTRPDGHSALLACSLVCRSWQRQAQQELFLCVSFTSTVLLKRWHCAILPESGIPSYVRALHWGVRPGTTEQPDPFLENYFPELFATFSNIETLHMSDLSLLFFDTAAIKRTFSHLSHSLQRLDIDRLTTDPKKWCFLISLLPNLRFLHIRGATMLEEERGLIQNHLPSHNFTGHIAAFGSKTEQFFRCIADLRPRFETLDVSGINNSLVDTFNLVVQNCSATLTTISIIPPGLEMRAVEAMAHLDLSSCSNLRTLRISPYMTGFPEMSAILKTISSKRFGKLMVGPQFGGMPVSWAERDQVFRSFAERLYELGGVKPLTVVVAIPVTTQGGDGDPDVQSVWPLFSEVGVIAKEYYSHS